MINEILRLIEALNLSNVFKYFFFSEVVTFRKNDLLGGGNGGLIREFY